MYIAGESKEYIRENVFSFFSNSVNILTLPNLHFNLENKLINAGKNVSCFEYDKSIFKKQQLINPKSISLNYGNVLNYNPYLYDGIFLDLCGVYNENVGLFLQKVTKGTNIIVTFLMARESRQLQNVIDINNREFSYVRLFKSFNIEIDFFISYTDSSPMCCFFGNKF